MSGAGGAGKEASDGDSLAHAAFAGMSAQEPVFKQLRTLLLHGRRSEAVRLICENDQRFSGEEAQKLVDLIMTTLRDTTIDP